MFSKRLEDVRGDELLALPLHRVRVQVLPDEGAASFLERPVRVGVVWRWEPAEIRRFGEGDRVGRVGGHCDDYAEEDWEGDSRMRSQMRRGEEKSRAGMGVATVIRQFAGARHLGGITTALPWVRP